MLDFTFHKWPRHRCCVSCETVQGFLPMGIFYGRAPETCFHIGYAHSATHHADAERDYSRLAFGHGVFGTPEGNPGPSPPTFSQDGTERGMDKRSGDETPHMTFSYLIMVYFSHQKQKKHHTPTVANTMSSVEKRD